MNGEKIQALSELYGFDLRAINRVDEDEVSKATKVIEDFLDDHYGDEKEAGYIRDAYECLVWLWFPLNNYYLKLIHCDKIVALLRYPVKMKLRCPDCKGLHQKEFVKYVCATCLSGSQYKLHYVLESKDFTNFMKREDVEYQTYRNCKNKLIDCYYGKEMFE